MMWYFAAYVRDHNMVTQGRFASGSKDMPFVGLTKLVTGAYKLILPIASGVIAINSKI